MQNCIGCGEEFDVRYLIYNRHKPYCWGCFCARKWSENSVSLSEERVSISVEMLFDLCNYAVEEPC